MPYTLHYADGTAPDTLPSNTDPGAIRDALARLDAGAVANDTWEPSGPDAERLLIWASEADANGPHGNGDDGSKAIAEIVRITRD